MGLPSVGGQPVCRAQLGFHGLGTAQRRHLGARVQVKCSQGARSTDTIQLALRKAILAEEYESAAKLRDELNAHPDNVVKQQRAGLQAKLRSAVASEDYKKAVHLQQQLDSLPPVEEEQPSSSASLEHTSSCTTRGIKVDAISAYIPAKSNEGTQQFFFVYKITIENTGQEIMQLHSRHWHITDATGHEEWVRGPGVIGKKPVLGPGQRFQYTSACPIRTRTGSMKGTFQCVFLQSDVDVTADDDNFVDIEIAEFLLTTAAVGKLD